MSLKTNDIVEIFTDPITQQHPEGQAKLVKLVRTRLVGCPATEDWEVEFTEEPGTTFTRTILVE